MAKQPTDVGGEGTDTEAAAGYPDHFAATARLFTLRVRSVLLTIAVLIGVGFPALCLTMQYIQHKDLENVATGYARELAEVYGASKAQNVADGKGGMADHLDAAVYAFPLKTRIISVCLLDKRGECVGYGDHSASDAGWGWKPIARGDPEPIRMGGEPVGMLRVDITFQPSYGTTLFVLLASLAIGMGVVWVSYRLPERIAGGLEEHVNSLKAEIELKHRTAGAERSNKELQQLAYCISHDLQEPLRGIFGYLQLLQRRYTGKLDATADEFINKASAGAIRLRDMINGILAYSRVQTRGERFHSVDCEAIIEEVVANLNASIQESGAMITWDSLPVVYGDRSQMVPLFQNLVSNAIKFSGKNRPEIRVSAKEEDGEWVIAVKDNGIGIDLKHMERIFVLFQRLHGTAIPGDGIGLAICRRIVERHGGRIWVESEPERGSIFCFTLKSAAHAGVS